MVKPPCLNFRVITAKKNLADGAGEGVGVLGSEFLRFP